MKGDKERRQGRRARALARFLSERRRSRTETNLVRERPLRLLLRRKPRNIPVYWMRLSFLADTMLSPHTAGLILSSRTIPWVASAHGHLYVPPLYSRKAAAELTSYVQENRDLPPPPQPIVYHNASWMLGIMLLLIFWHGVVMSWWPGTGAIKAEVWKTAGSLDVFRTAYLSEWWRCLTALTLHTDSKHLFGNVFAGSVFLILLGRMTGAGPAFLLTILAGGLGNALNVLYRSYSHNSLGFSTAVFGTVGLAAAVHAVRSVGKGRILLPLAAGVGILASLGTGDIQGRTDYAAHIFGLLAGLAVGGVYGKFLLLRPCLSLLFRSFCFVLAFVLLLGAWLQALGFSL